MKKRKHKEKKSRKEKKRRRDESDSSSSDSPSAQRSVVTGRKLKLERPSESRAEEARREAIRRAFASHQPV